MMVLSPCRHKLPCFELRGLGVRAYNFLSQCSTLPVATRSGLFYAATIFLLTVQVVARSTIHT